MSWVQVPSSTPISAQVRDLAVTSTDLARVPVSDLLPIAGVTWLYTPRHAGHFVADPLGLLDVANAELVESRPATVPRPGTGSFDLFKITTHVTEPRQETR
jgi:hypothetical protein